MIGAVREHMCIGSDSITKSGEKVDEDGDRIRLRVGLKASHDVTRKAVQGVTMHRRPAGWRGRDHIRGLKAKSAGPIKGRDVIVWLPLWGCRRRRGCSDCLGLGLPLHRHPALTCCEFLHRKSRTA